MNDSRINGDYYRIGVLTNDGKWYSFVRLFPGEDWPYECFEELESPNESGADGFTWRLDPREFADWMNKKAAHPGIAQIAFLPTEIEK